MNQNDIANLTDQELFAKLTSYDVKCGPVTETTRKLYQNILFKKSNNLIDSEEILFQKEEEEEEESVLEGQNDSTRLMQSPISEVITLSNSYNTHQTSYIPSPKNFEINSPKPIDNSSEIYYKSTPKEENLRLSPSTTFITVPETYIDENGCQQVRFVRKRVPRSQFASSTNKSFTPRDIKKDFGNTSQKQIKKNNNNNYNMQIIFAVGFISLTLITYFLFGFN